MIPTVETERLILREWRELDYAAFARFKADPMAAKFGGQMNSHEAWRAMLYYIGHWHVRGFGFWSVALKSTGEPIGYCGPYFPIEWPEPEIGWGIYMEHQRKGYAYESACAALAYVYGSLGWKSAISLIADDNQPSKALATKMGAKPDYAFELRRHSLHCLPSSFTNRVSTPFKENMKWQ